MSLLFMDGFDHYDGNNANLALGQYLSASGAQLSSTQVRTGSRSAIGTSTSSGELIYGFPALKSEIGFGFGMFFDSTPGSTVDLCELRDSAGTGANIIFRHLSTGAIEIRRSSSGGTVIATTSPTVLSPGHWNHIEIRSVASNTVGEIEIRINEVIVLNATALDTVQGGTEHYSGVKLYVTRYGSGTTNMRYVDDFFVWDTAGSSNNDFLGDRRVLTLLPNANETTQEMTVSGAANAYTAIQSADGDTSYIVASDSTPVTSEFALENAGANVGAINAVQVSAMMRKTAAGAATMQLSMISGGDVSAGSSHSITDSFAYYHSVFETNPDTGAPWNASSINAASMRIRRTS